MAVARGKTYPRFGANIWWELRGAFRKERPEVVDVPYLIGQLGQSEKSARNLLPNFRALGLIDESGRPTELADRWATDATYGCALDEMVRRAYGEAVEQFPTPPSDRAVLEDWFAATTGTGENSVRQMASFYLLLTARDAVAGGERNGTVSSNGGSAAVEPESMVTEPAPGAFTPGAFAPIEVVAETAPNHVSAAPSAPSPVLHLHLHFASDASEAQVEALMRSVTKYL